MRRSISAVLLLVISAAAIIAQNDRTTRPRVVITPPPPVLQTGTDENKTPTGPPVLGGRSGNPSPAPTVEPIEDDDDGIIRVETNLVAMPVAVLDKDGRFISGLQQRDFKIFENGVEQKIEYFQSVEQPFSVVLMIDVSPSTQFRIDEIQNSAIAFVDKLRAGDRVMIVSFDEKVRVLTPFTSDRYVLRNAIRQATVGNGTSLYEAVDQVINRHLAQVEGRKAVVLFSDGVDTTSRRANFENTLRAAEEADALIYTVRYDTSGYAVRGGGSPQPQRRPSGRVTMGDILAQIIIGATIGGGSGGSIGHSRGEYEKGREYMDGLAQNSGGRKFEADTIVNVDAAFSSIAEELRRQYSIGYYPENVGKIGERKQIRIRVMRPGVSVRAKNSYIVGRNGTSASR
jgi:VWFA-related protein